MINPIVLSKTDSNTKQLFLEISTENRDAFNALFHRKYEKLVRFAQNFVAVNSLAEEAVSDVFVSVWINRDKLPAIDNPDTYLYVSVKNRCLNTLRSKPYTIAIDEQPDIKKTEYDTPHKEMEYRELYEKLNRLINQLPEQQRLVFRMIKENGLSAKECARILNISVRTAETHVYKAVKKLEEEITAYLGYSPKKKTTKRMIMLAL
ncbi:MAG TPA: RNA polymerase sigma-70 factor [Petrimonas sp.]|nr:RNA polymerase sigma-70 factor [Petrimonas sp.]